MTARQKAAQLLGRLGAAKGGKARAAKLTPEERSEAARRAVRARWKRRLAGHDGPNTRV